MKFNTCNYSVEIDLQGAEFCLHQSQIKALEKRLGQIGSDNPWFTDICSLRNGTLRYESLSILPPQTNADKNRVLLVLGNPTIIGVKHGMFYFSRQDGGRHGFWSKLARAGLVETVATDSRAGEARARHAMLVNDQASPAFSVGITTFYSFPTPGSDHQRYSGSAGVEQLFEPILKQIRLMETRRLLSYPFTAGSVPVFTRKSALEHFYRLTGIKPLYWPIRGEDSSGERLAELLSRSGGPRLASNPLLF